ncbi:MAG TPA: hypothetical protein VMY37_31020 [Thermoguttaceae bacterium]|nr:hypothetical protein [Thermoguttaceae bacterium]
MPGKYGLALLRFLLATTQFRRVLRRILRRLSALLGRLLEMVIRDLQVVLQRHRLAVAEGLIPNRGSRILKKCGSSD